MMASQNQEVSNWFNQEIITHDKRLRAYLRKQESELADVDDIMQESYSRIVDAKRTKIIRFPKSLLFKIASNVSNERLRKKYRNKTITVGGIEAFSETTPTPHGIVDQIDKHHNIMLLQQALESLPPRCRKVMILRTYEKLSFKEIAAQLDISVETVHVQWVRGLKKCRKFFERNSDSL
jgi:RNA polymerase sigma factor (sigma-70 family)